MAYNYNLDDLNTVQKQIVYDTDGAILVSAGAGSGKTRLLTHKIAYYVDKMEGLSVDPSRILAVTFTNKAANEMKERIYNMTEPNTIVNISTFHSWCAKFLRKNINCLEGYNSNYSIYDEDDSKKLLRKIVKSFADDCNEFETYCWHISNAKNLGYDPIEYSKEYGFYKNIDKITKIYKEYERNLNESNALDFDDLLLKTLKILQNNIDIRNEYQNKYDYIFIDEFQDINLVQYKIIKILVSNNNKIFVVGDEDQLIYSWRGAHSGIIDDFMNDFADCKVYKLEQNYRSTKSILSSANCLIKNNSSRIDKTLFTENVQGEDVVLHASDDEIEECDWVARNIYNLFSCGVSYDEVGVLMRISSLSRIMEEKLLNYNIPFKVSGIFKFFERAEIKNVVAYMSCVVNEHDGVALSRIINFPKRGIGESSIESIAQTALDNGVSMREVALNGVKYGLSSALCSKLAPFAQIINELLVTLDSMSMTEWVKNLLKITGINDLYNTKTEEDTSRKLNIEQLVQSVAAYENANDGDSIADYLQSVTLQNDLSEEDVPNSVSISTVHAAKGLEFKYVFIIGAEEGIFPLSRSFDEPDELEEERRLMYVAITRAKTKLFVSYAKSRYLYGKRSYTTVSRFVKEMGLQKNFGSKQNVSNYATSSPYKFNRIGTTTDVAYDNEMWKSKINKQSDKFSEYKVGEMVLHPKFGVGTIIKTELIGENSYVSVDFSGIGVKTLALNFAPLQLIKKR